MDHDSGTSRRGDYPRFLVCGPAVADCHDRSTSLDRIHTRIVPAVADCAFSVEVVAAATAAAAAAAARDYCGGGSIADGYN